MNTASNPLWEGKGISAPALNYTAGKDIILDKKLVPYELKVIKVHIDMLSKRGLLKNEDNSKITAVLEEIKELDTLGKFQMKVELEDVHSNVEQYIISKLGMEIGGNVRLAIARNDQVYTDLRLFYKDELNKNCQLLKKLILTLAQISEGHTQTIMPGYTHLRISQPITLGFFLCSKAYHFLDDLHNLEYDLAQINKCPLGIFEMSGTCANIDRHYTANALGFSKPTENALYTANQRGEIEIKILSDLSLMALHIKRFVGELILFSTHEFGFLKISSKYTTGGTAQPNLENPDTLEVMRANCAKIMGAQQTLFMMMGCLPSGFNRDTQETKGVIFDALELVGPTLILLEGIIKTCEFDTEKMQNTAEINFSSAPDYTIELAISSGLSFRESYKIVKHIIKNKMIKNSLREIDSKMLSSCAQDLLGKKISFENMPSLANFCTGKTALLRESFGGSSQKQVMGMVHQLMAEVDKNQA